MLIGKRRKADLASKQLRYLGQPVNDTANRLLRNKDHILKARESHYRNMPLVLW